MTSPNTVPAVSFSGVSKAFDSVLALKDIFFDIPAGSIYGVVGTSGAGKSTLLRTVNGLESVTGGTVTTLGRDVAKLRHSELRQLRRQMGMVFQHHNLIDSKTVAENVAMPLVLASVAKSERDSRVKEVLELVGLAERAGHRPAQLSGGQRQRVGIARALVMDPKILLCDEPTSALDPLTTSQILELLERINEELGLTILIITHQMSAVSRIADNVAVLENGELIENGAVRDVFAHPQQPLTRRFVETVVPQKLPDSVVADLREHPFPTTVRIVHTGGAARDIIGQFSERFDVTAQLLHAADAPLRHSSVGTLVLGLNGASASISSALSWADRTDGLNVEVLP
ncbi:ABC transporter [Corynebacterium yudongzhengii]|uniref:ABC transporter n=1 Tax=Corynebacterium yudongzhengii TaxID=2080740 RepID=A0A2U1T6N5_9CORY|nr:ATP-binding cassette domain-containing protein [Corynebacterium yudongzhengii]AWB82198.1 ABC transporter [Corynebacterium yudongzhengii]PWC01649.1 ABC transporter [Corynebacterium yudongzhengii]